MQKQKTGMVTGKEKASYGLYFLGRNIFYKLNDHDVQLMAKVNNGEMSREEAEAQMINK